MSNPGLLNLEPLNPTLVLVTNLFVQNTIFKIFLNLRGLKLWVA